MKIQGSITQIKSRVNASGDTVNTVTVEVFSDEIPLPHAYLRKPIEIQVTEVKA